MLAGLGVGGYYAVTRYFWRPTVAVATLTSPVTRSRLRVTVTERGNLESANPVDAICEVEGYENKIVFILPEGTTVAAGDVVVRIDTAKIDKEIQLGEIALNEAQAKIDSAVQEIEVQKNQNESDINAAELELKLAKLDVTKYLEGDYNVEKNDRNGSISLAMFELERAKDKLEQSRKLVKKGFREPEYLRQLEEDVRRWEYSLDRDNDKLLVLEKFERERKVTELEAKSTEAGKKLERAAKTAEAKLLKLEKQLASAKSDFEMRKADLEDHRKQRALCEIKAAQAGVVAYANDEWYRSDRQIREGAMVHFRQKLFTLPDMTQMQVKVNVHESQIKKVKVGQKAQIRVDAFAQLVAEGTVKQVSQLADSTNPWMRGGVKEYTTIVALDKLPDAPLKPGMTAECEILVDDLQGVLVVPVQSVTEHKHGHYAYVSRGGEAFARQGVEIGESNERFVQVKTGLDEGQQVALDARSRGLADFGKESDANEEEAQPAAPAAQPAAAPVTAAVGG